MGRQPPAQVLLHKIERGTVEKTVSNTRAGTVEACRRSKLSMPSGGRVDSLLVDEGDQVERGQILLSLWNKDRMAMQAQASAMLLSRHGAEKICVEADNAEREANRSGYVAGAQTCVQEATELGRTKAQGSGFACQAPATRNRSRRLTSISTTYCWKKRSCARPLPAPSQKSTARLANTLRPRPRCRHTTSC
ncbi:MAG: efflux RND transporter periplasmic adaptor subunit [Haliea sp.]|nr:efflux RND transporter periplasmic adaptor subunit [Haliea sp.]